MVPFFVVIDMTTYNDEDNFPFLRRSSSVIIESDGPRKSNDVQASWPPLKSQISHCRDMVMECYYKVLDQVAERFDKGEYDLDRYRRVLNANRGRGRGGFRPNDDI